MNSTYDDVQEKILSLNLFFKQNQLKIESWLNYFEKIQQNCQSIILITQRAIQQSTPYADQPMSTTFVTLNGSMKIILECIQKSLPKIKQHKNKLDDIVTSGCQNTKELVSELKQQCQQYDQSINKIKQSNYDQKDIQQIIEHNGKDSHEAYETFIEKVNIIKKKFKIKLTKNSQNLCDELNALNDIINDIYELIKSLFNSGDQKKIDGKFAELLNDYQVSISESFHIIKKYAGNVNVSYFEPIPKVWNDFSNIQPFYARVWTDYTAKNSSEITVHKKEKVYVTECGYNSYWQAEKSNKQKGYIPSYILEPVK